MIVIKKIILSSLIISFLFLFGCSSLEFEEKRGRLYITLKEENTEINLYEKDIKVLKSILNSDFEADVTYNFNGSSNFTIKYDNKGLNLKGETLALIDENYFDFTLLNYSKFPDNIEVKDNYDINSDIVDFLIPFSFVSDLNYLDDIALDENIYKGSEGFNIYLDDSQLDILKDYDYSSILIDCKYDSSNESLESIVFVFEKPVENITINIYNIVR